MILLDANVLLYAYNPSFPQHRRARTWLEQNFSAPAPIGLPWATIFAFLRIGTNPRAFPEPLTTDEAVAVVSAWLTHPTVTVLTPGERHWSILQDLLLRVRVRGAQVADAHLAALAIEHGATLCTTDRDFAVFGGLRLMNPLE